MASIYTYGEPVPGAYMPDLDNAGCILFWGYNPSVARLAHATSATTRSASGRPRTPTPYRRAPKRADNAERKINNSQVGS
jgi:anaerobic selenocysteine-containing dehydrogenase